MRWKQERSDLHHRLNDFSRAHEKLKDDASKYKGSSKQYKDKLKMANNTIRTLSQKIAQYELERQAERDVDDIRVGSQTVGGGRISHQSNRGSEAEIKEVVQKILQDDNLR